MISREEMVTVGKMMRESKAEIINDIIELRKVSEELGEVCRKKFTFILKNNGQEDYVVDQLLVKTLNNKLKYTLDKIREEVLILVNEF